MFCWILLIFTIVPYALADGTEIDMKDVSNITVSEDKEINPGEAMVTSLITTQGLILKGCICYFLYKPVCATDGETYGNACFLRCAQRQDPFLMGVCNGDCPCCKEPYHNDVDIENFEGLFEPGPQFREPHPLYYHLQMRPSKPHQNMAPIKKNHGKQDHE